ncbi:MAG: HNH endonuclease [Desulfobaccales bacterium]
MYIQAERLRELLEYNPNTGIFYWKEDRGNGRVGKVAGCLNSEGYWKIKVDLINYLAHRLAWFYMVGIWPKDQIDHINGTKTDNSWANLREATPTINTENVHKARKDNACGLLGVSYKKSCSSKHPWMSSIQVSGKRKRLGLFSTPEDAHIAYLKAKRELHAGYVPQVTII